MEWKLVVGTAAKARGTRAAALARLPWRGGAAAFVAAAAAVVAAAFLCFCCCCCCCCCAGAAPALDTPRFGARAAAVAALPATREAGRGGILKRGNEAGEKEREREKRKQREASGEVNRLEKKREKLKWPLLLENQNLSLSPSFLSLSPSLSRSLALSL